MASYEQIMTALRNADAAGDTAAATRLAQLAREAKSAQVPGQGFGNNVAQAAGDGAFFGFGDEISARLNAMTGYDANTGTYGNWGTTYADQLAAVRGQEKQFREGHPYVALGAEVAGGLLPGAAMVKGVAAGATLGQQALRGAGTGAAAGAAYGFGEGEGAGDRLSDGVKGAFIGAGTGAATPALAQLARKSWTGGKAMLADRRKAGQVAQQFGIDKRAGRLLNDVIGMDDAARMRGALSTPDAMLADAGPSTQGALDAVIQSPGEGARMALRRIDERAAQAGQRLNQTLDLTLGAPQGIQTAQGAIRQGSAPVRQAAYDAAYARPIDYGTGAAGDALMAMRGRIPASAIADANKLMKLEGVKSQQIMAKLDDLGNVVGFERLPDVRQWDYIKRALDQAAASGDGAGALGGQTPMGRAYQGLARDIRDTVAEAVPEYRTALDTAAEAIGQVQGVKFGSTLLRPGTTREEAASMLKGMTVAERAAVKQGVRSQIDDTLANVRAIATDPNIDARQAYKAMTDLSSPSAQAKMELLLGNEWLALKAQLDQTATALGLRARVATNSRTFQRQQFGQMLDDSMTPGRVRSGEFIGVTAPIKQAWQNVTGSTPAAVQKATAKARNELADVLTRPGARQALDAIEAIQRSNIVPADAGSALQRLLLMGLLGNSGQMSSAITERMPQSLPLRSPR